jgi:hypothetical protein
MVSIALPIVAVSEQGQSSDRFELLLCDALPYPEPS